MVKYLFCLVLLNTTSNFFSQDCKFKRNGIDEFTKKQIVETKDSYLSASITFFTRASFKKIDGKTYMTVLFSQVGGTFIVKEGAEFLMLAQGGEVIKFTVPETEVSGTRISTLARTSSLAIDFGLSEETANKLLSQKIEKVRLYTTDGYVDTEVKDKYWRKLKEHLRCVR